LGNYNIKRGSVIDLITPVNDIHIFVKTQEGKKITTEVSSSLYKTTNKKERRYFSVLTSFRI
jgi:rRNA processing protein Gar1